MDTSIDILNTLKGRIVVDRENLIEMGYSRESRGKGYTRSLMLIDELIKEINDSD